jgi:LuxR family maltose regulon positive regulatory protein
VVAGLYAVNRLRFTDLDWLAPAPAPAAIQPPAGQPTLAAPAAGQPLPEPLSLRELEVLRWIDQGLSNAEIARQLVVANSTVKTHINNIYTKLGVDSRLQALRRAKELGLL